MKKSFTFILSLFVFIASTAAQDRAATNNPLTQLRDEVKAVLAEARRPFTDEQERAIALMMEDRRQASEQLFGDLMDFRSGPTQGQDADRLRSAIEWMRNEFLTRLQDYLTPEQFAAWSRSRETRPAAPAASATAAPPARQNQTQFVRINNNAFTAEDSTYRFGRSGSAVQAAPEVIQRGGAGAFHGNAQFLLKDEALNATRRFARNKPEYQERQTGLDISGPIWPGRLTTSFGFSQNEAENVDTIRATLLDQIFALGITRPTTNRSFSTRNTYQLADSHSLSFNAGYQTTSSKNQGVGGFVMPERAFRSEGSTWNFEVRQFSSLSPASIYETRFAVSGLENERMAETEGVQINVLDAFNAGGAQNRLENMGRTYDISNLYSRLGEKLTVKAGMAAMYRRNHSHSENNFLGTFTFSSLDGYRAGTPLTFRVNRGNPISDTNQWELSFFIQNDLKVSPRLSLMYGTRYELQTNLGDRNNIAPRAGLAYALDQATVLRGGVGIFHQRMLFNIIEVQRRQDGVQQYEVIIDNPSYPDPSQSGSIRTTFPSVRVIDPSLAVPYNFVSMISYERTFSSTLFVSAAFDLNREVRRPRLRNLNAPMDITSPAPKSCSPGQTRATCVRPIPDRGNILNFESTGSETAKNIRLSLRQRFSIFNVSANYARALIWSDSIHSVLVAQNFPNGTVFGLPEGISADSYNLRSDWSIAGTPPRHTFSTVTNARLPLGLFLTGTMNAASGRPYTILTGRDDNQDNSLNDRPAGELRNSGTGPKSLSFDFNISKAIFLGDAPAGGTGIRPNVNIFANMTNAFNRPNYNPPSGVMTSPNFGRSTSAGNPREIEVGLRLQF